MNATNNNTDETTTQPRSIVAHVRECLRNMADAIRRDATRHDHRMHGWANDAEHWSGMLGHVEDGQAVGGVYLLLAWPNGGEPRPYVFLETEAQQCNQARADFIAHGWLATVWHVPAKTQTAGRSGQQPRMVAAIGDPPLS